MDLALQEVDTSLPLDEKIDAYLSILVTLKGQAKIKRRPIVIEFCGTPKAGKSTCIDAVKNLLKLNGFKVFVIHEKAKICPVNDKFDPFFNFWTATSTINELAQVLDQIDLYKYDEKVDVILLDRGLFDSLAWFTWLKNNKSINEEEYSTFANLLLWKDFRSKVDRIFIFDSSCDDALDREPSNILTSKYNVIMKPKVLNDFNKAMVEATTNFSSYFINKIDKIDSKRGEEKLLIKTVALKVLESFYGHYNEDIAFVDKKVVNLPQKSGVYDYDILNDAIKEVQFGNRKLVEENDECLQLIPIAIIKDGDSILCVKKTKHALNDFSEASIAPEKGKELFYIGGHVRKEDIDNEDNLTTVKNALNREIREEIHIRISIPDTLPKLVYSIDLEKSKKHIALYWIIDIDSEKMNIRIDGSELLRNKGTTKSGKFFKIDELDSTFALETWSKLILLEEFRNQVNKDFLDYLQGFYGQLTMFGS